MANRRNLRLQDLHGGPQIPGQNGLKVDGIAGPETLAALGLPTGQAAKATSAQPSSNRNLDLLAHLVTAKRGESLISDKWQLQQLSSTGQGTADFPTQ